MTETVKKVALKCATVVALLALLVTNMNVNSTCILFAHQPKLPDTAKKLRIF